jgi:hypothetical protein
MIAGQGEGIIAIDQSFFDPASPIGTVVGLDSVNQKIIVGEPANNQYIIVGIRSTVEQITNYGIYVNPVNVYNPMQKLYCGTGSTAGRLTTISNNYPIGYAIGPVNTTNAVGYLCWIDFTFGTFGGTPVGLPGPPGPVGPTGPSGIAGSSAGIMTPGCYLHLVGANLVLSPYNGNLIVINQTVQKIPFGGVALAPTGLAVNTLYYIYAYMSGATMVLEASATSHITSTINGVEIKSGDQSRTLVGMAVTVSGAGGAAWTDVAPGTTTGSGGSITSGVDIGKLYVLSWFNPRPKSGTSYFNFIAGQTGLKVHQGRRTTSPNFVELGQEIGNFFLTWQNRKVRYVTAGAVACLAPQGAGSTVQFDGRL